MKKYFPILSDTSCRLKWSWSTLFLNSGKTASCHRASSSLIPDDFSNFHNTQEKIRDRQLMLEDKWPGHGCEYCRDIEAANGVSDRQFQNQIPDVYPSELDNDSSLTTVDPVVLEVFFSNTCNLGCVYCRAELSSTIQMEDLAHNGPILQDNEFNSVENQYKNLNPKFWEWFYKNSYKLKRLQILGGEPFLQKDLIKMLDHFEQTKHPELEFNLITNLALHPKIINPYLDRLAKLKRNGNLKRIDILASIDSWDSSQEYVRYKLDLDQFEQNMNYMLDQNAYRVGLLSTVNSLTINSMPALAQKYTEWNKKQIMFWYMHLVLPIETSIFSPVIFDFEVFKESLEQTQKLLPTQTWDDKKTIETFDGIVAKLEKMCSTDVQRQAQLLSFLQQNDQRRGNSWQEQFPWLVKEFKKNHAI